VQRGQREDAGGAQGMKPTPRFTCIDPSSKRGVTRPKAKAARQVGPSARSHSCNAPGGAAKYDRAEEDVKDGAAN
jgi:hypothetical protein